MRNKIKKCNHCGTFENLIVDKRGRIYSICKKCSSELAKKGTDKQKIYKEKLNNPYIKRGKNNITLFIDKKFFEVEYIDKNILLDELADKYGIGKNTLLKYLKKYNIKEIHLCRHCKTTENLLFMENRICNCCSNCWGKTYINRKRKISKKIIKEKKLITTSGIGIKAQFFFTDFEKELKNINFNYNELIYGFYDLKLRKRIKSEKTICINLGTKTRYKSLDCYIRIGDNEFDIEYDENGHFEEKNISKDILREDVINKCYPNLTILRVSEKEIKHKGKEYVIKKLISILKGENLNSYPSYLYEYLMDSEIEKLQEKHYFFDYYDSIPNKNSSNLNFFNKN
jgi:hypothetical protein